MGNEEIFFQVLFKNNGRLLSAQEYLDFSKEFLLKLKEFDPCFHNVYAWGKTARAGRYLQEDLSDFHEVVFKQIYSKGACYINAEGQPEKEFSLSSRCCSGYLNSYSSSKSDRDKKISISISHLGELNNVSDVLVFDFNKHLQQELNLHDLIARLEFTINNLPVLRTYIGSYEFTKIAPLPKDEALRKTVQNTIRIGWINYLWNPEVDKILPAEISRKVLPNGGVIFWLTEEKALSTNQEAVEKAIMVRDAFEKHGLIEF